MQHRPPRMPPQPRQPSNTHPFAALRSESSVAVAFASAEVLPGAPVHGVCPAPPPLRGLGRPHVVALGLQVVQQVRLPPEASVPIEIHRKAMKIE